MVLFLRGKQKVISTTHTHGLCVCVRAYFSIRPSGWGEFIASEPESAVTTSLRCSKKKQFSVHYSSRPHREDGSRSPSGHLGNVVGAGRGVVGRDTPKNGGDRKRFPDRYRCFRSLSGSQPDAICCRLVLALSMKSNEKKKLLDLAFLASFGRKAIRHLGRCGHMRHIL